MSKIYLSIVIPAFNEEKRIVKTLDEISNYLASQQYESEVIVVDDGSSDKTTYSVKGFQDKIKNLQLTSNHLNRGKGFSVRRGLLLAKGQYSLFMDADNSTSIKEVNKFFPFLTSGYDVVIGSREISGSQIVNPQSPYRRILGRLYGLLVHIIIGLCDLRDIQCGFKIFNEKCLEDILKRWSINGFSFDSEILIIAKKLGYKIKEVPVNWENHPQSKVKISGMFNATLDLFKIRWNLIRNKYKV